MRSQNYLDTLTEKLNKAENDSVKIELYVKTASKKRTHPTTRDSLFLILNSKFPKNCFNNSYIPFKIGQYYESKSADESIRYYLEALKEAEKCNSHAGISRAFNRLGRVNIRQKNYKTAINYLHLSIYHCNKCSNVYDLAESFTLLGTIYKNSDLIDSSLYYHNKSLDIRLKLGDKKLISLTYNNIALAYKKLKKFDLALEYLNKAYDLVLELKDNKGTATLNNNLCNVYRSLKKYQDAIRCGIMARDTAFKYKISDNYLNSLTSLAEAYEANSDFKNSNRSYKVHLHAFDSIRQNETNSDYQELQAKYESDKKDAELLKKETNLKLAESENSKKNIVLISSLLALLVAYVASIFIYRSYKLSKRNALELADKNKVISEKNKEITDSINYAKNIQQSLLTSDKTFKENTKEFFVLYQPKDIVSGDFYWAQKTEQGFMVVCADCTGHGVPGAFMSLLGISYLKEIVLNKHLNRPDLILNELRSKVIAGFNINNNSDGMDLSLISLEGNTLKVAAANNPVWIIRNKQNLIIKPDKFPIGKHYGELKNFSMSSFSLQTGDLIIQFTDGFADQFGGPQGKKYKYKNIEKLIIENSEKPLDDIQKCLKDSLTNWKGQMEQVDDILIIGIRV